MLRVVLMQLVARSIFRDQVVKRLVTAAREINTHHADTVKPQSNHSNEDRPLKREGGLLTLKTVYYINLKNNMELTKQNIVDFLLQKFNGSSVKHFIEEVCHITNQGDMCITKKGNTIQLISNNPHASLIGGDAISAIVLALNILEELSNNGCVIVYQMNKNDQVSIGNESITDGKCFEITNDIILKYIDKELLVTDELQKFKERGCLSLNDYNDAESLKMAQRTLKASKINIWIAIVVAMVDLILRCIC